MDSTTIKKILNQLGLELPHDKISKLNQFKTLLYEENERLNLTRVPESDFLRRHVIDSLLLYPFLHQLTPRSVLDFGSGGGLPGVPLAIFLQDCEFSLYDKSAKKTKYLTKLQTLSPNITVLDRIDRQFDVVISRAVAKTAELIHVTAGLYKVAGLSLKSKRALEEVNALNTKLFINVFRHNIEDFDLDTHVLVYSVNEIKFSVQHFTLVFPRNKVSP